MQRPGRLSPNPRPCKICGAHAPLFGVVDFSKNCAEGDGVKLPLSGFPVYFRRCSFCEFLFTEQFDDWSISDFAEYIYNADYIKVDPSYIAVRPTQDCTRIEHFFGEHRDVISILDYGGGDGEMVDRLRQAGFADCAFYDPFHAVHNRLPARRFNLVTSFETLEHTPDPVGAVRDIVGCLDADGLVIFSTLVQPPDIDQLGMSWWYAGPRNGHISLYSTQALK